MYGQSIHEIEKLGEEMAAGDGQFPLATLSVLVLVLLLASEHCFAQASLRFNVSLRFKTGKLVLYTITIYYMHFVLQASDC